MNNSTFSTGLSEKSAHQVRGRQIKKMTKGETVFVFAIAAAVSFLTAITETCFFFNFRPFGFAPELCLALTVASGVKFGPKFGGIMGLLAGFFISAFSAAGLSLAALFYTLLGIAMGIFASPESASRLSAFSLFLVGTLSGAAIIGLGDIIRIGVVHSSAPLAVYILRTVLPEMLCTLVFSPFVYLPTALAARHIRKRQGLSAK